MSDKLELRGETYQNIGGEWYDANFIRAPQVIASQLDAIARATGEQTPVSARRKVTESSGSGSKNSAFSHADVFPIIAQLIHELYEENGEFVKYGEIREALLAHDEGRAHIDRAVEQKGHTAEDWASWMMGWFGAAITDNRSPYQDDFERERIEGRWAYRPVEG